MNVLFQSPLGALLARPWVDRAGLVGELCLTDLMPCFDIGRRGGGIAGEDVDLVRGVERFDVQRSAGSSTNGLSHGSPLRRAVRNEGIS